MLDVNIAGKKMGKNFCRHAIAFRSLDLSFVLVGVSADSCESLAQYTSYAHNHLLNLLLVDGK